jgi:hypothetical protein
LAVELHYDALAFKLFQKTQIDDASGALRLLLSAFAELLYAGNEDELRIQIDLLKNPLS